MMWFFKHLLPPLNDGPFNAIDSIAPANGRRIYSNEFFKNHIKGSRRSAEVIVPMVVDLIRPRSIVDVGCGLGAWLAVFRENGVADLMGIDLGYLDESQLLVAKDEFQVIDLTRPFTLEREFDLVVCLEVAEHLPEPSAAGLIASLVRLGKAVLFSAAIPGQGGINHVNEQWQSYWQLQFQKHNYELIDFFRPTIWTNNRVQLHYRQNMFLFTNERASFVTDDISEKRAGCRSLPVSIVHPDLWEAEHLNVRPTIGSLIREMPRAISRSMRNRFRSK